MTYTLEFTTVALQDIDKHKKSGDKALLRKLSVLLKELMEHPRSGTGKVEHLKNLEYGDTWSRRLNDKHRLVYEIHENKVVVKVLTAYGHYNDK